MLVTGGLLGVALVLWSWGSGGVPAGAGGRPAPLGHVVIAPGQTLWQLAEQLAPSADPRDVVQAIESLNHLTGPEVTAGQPLLVPVGGRPG